MPEVPPDVPPVDFEAVFNASPVPYFVATPDLRLVAVSDAYVEVTGRTREDLVGRSLFELFPGNPDDPNGDNEELLRESLLRTLRTGRADPLPLLRYDILDPASSSWSERFWSAIHVPVSVEGEVRWVLQRTTDVTDVVHAGRTGVRGGDEETWRNRLRDVEADLFARARELQRARDAEAAAARRLAGLTEAALALAQVQTVDELTTAVISQGMRGMGADGGAIGVVDADHGQVALAFADLGDQVRRRFERIPLDSGLPAAVTARTGRRVVLHDAEEGARWSPEMAEVHDLTGLQAWISLPLHTAGRTLGALTVGWEQPQVFADEDLGLYGAYAAQCAQALDRVQRLQQEREQADLQRHMAETLQRSLLSAPPEPDHLHVVVRYQPAAAHRHVGGDWFDSFVVPDGSTCLVIGDVTGHDERSVAAMGQIRNILRGVAYSVRDTPAGVLRLLDEAMRGMAVDALATIVLARVEQTPEQAERGMRTLRWSNAGHLPPLLLHSDGWAELLNRQPNLLMGLRPETTRQDHAVELGPGSTVVLYTDGLVERRGEPLGDGLERLRRTAEELAGLPMEELCDALVERLATVHDDDVALAAVRLHDESVPRPAEGGPVVVPGRV
ncbi:SpoIIE family protein phosphatase [Thalassiella azotivora]